MHIWSFWFSVYCQSKGLGHVGQNKLLNWDDVIPTESTVKWIQIFIDLFQMKKIQFYWCLKPKNTVGNPSLVLFIDGSEEGCGLYAYARLELDDWKYVNDAFMSKCLAEFIKKETRYNFEKKYYIVDSEINKSTVQKESYVFQHVCTYQNKRNSRIN